MAITQVNNNVFSLNYSKGSYMQNTISNVNNPPISSNSYNSNESKDVFDKKNNLKQDTFTISNKDNNYSRGLKVLDKEIEGCKRENFESDEAYTNHKKMLLDARQGYVGTEAEAKAKKTEARTTGAAKIIDFTGNFIGKAANLIGAVAPFLTKGA